MALLWRTARAFSAAASPVAAPAAIKAIGAHENFARVIFDNQTSADYHYFWLLHNCDESRHPQTNEKTLCSSKVPLDIKAERVEVSPCGQHATFTWSKPVESITKSVFSTAWLQQHAYALNRKVNAPAVALSKVLIDCTLTKLAPSALLAECRKRLETDGAVIVRGAGVSLEQIIENFAHGGLHVIPTHFGDIEDLRTDNTTNKNNDQLGYTNAAVELHTDQPFIAKPPHFQMLYCMRPAESGGENTLVDARAIAQHLRETDRHAYDLLRTVPVRFHRVQREFRSLHVGPIIEVNAAGVLTGVRSSYFTMDPHQLPFADMEQYYRAYTKFVELTKTPAFQYHALLQSGDFLAYDNHTMLHARTSFTGSRWLRGVYFDVR
eukprot:m.47517 g.47517  ORF g.47517 m.47517 type:complete len:379 (+) comp5985_c1_seq2:42-1178(+)